MAISHANFILTYLIKNEQLVHVHKSKNINNSFLDDYAFVIEALINLYEVTFDEKWLFRADQLTNHTLSNFYDPESGLFFYTPQTGEQLIARKQEIMDNVTPSSNSVMAHNLFRLGHFFDREDYLTQAGQMLKNVYPHIKSYGSAYSNWAILLLYHVFGIYEVAITGPKAEEKRIELEKYYIPNKIIMGGAPGSLPLLRDKWGNETSIFVCQNRTCGLPVSEVVEALKQIDAGRNIEG